MRRNNFLSMPARILSLLGVALLCGGSLQAQTRPNVLFIAVDDLRPELQCYGAEHIQSPNIDRLAEQGVLFERSYCMVPTCGASRASLMTSIRPARDRFVNYLAWAQKDAPNAIPLHSHFRSQGYTTISLGKILHHPTDHEDGWSKKPWRSKLSQYQNTAEYERDIREHRQQYPKKNRHRGKPYESADVPAANYPDGECTSRAIRELESLANKPDQPFFLAVGYLKPHLPFNAPQKYWDLYDAAKIDLPPNYFPPVDAPEAALHNSGELRAYAGIHPNKPVDRETARKLIHGYYACVSFVDAQIGELLSAVDKLGLSENTIVVLWGDHGWQLGEHGMWNKHSCFETSMHTPLIVRTPSSIGAKPGGRAQGLVEFIDIYPTLCELAGLETPSHVEGTSFVPQLRDPTLAGKEYAVGRFRNGDTIRSADFRYSEYAGANGMSLGSMLYNHQVDPRENKNVAQESTEIVQQLSEKLHEIRGR